jgi:hypothetical protein
VTGAFRGRQLIHRTPPADAPESIPARDSRPVIDPQLQLAQLRALADEAANAMAQMRELAERVRFGRDVISSIDESGRALATAMLAVARGPVADVPRPPCEACSGTGRVSATGGGICAPCRGSGYVAAEGSR